MTLFMQYVIPLAAIPAVAQFIGYGLIGIRVPFFGIFRLPLGTSLFRAIRVLRPDRGVRLRGRDRRQRPGSEFGSKQNLENAMKLVVYSMTPTWIAGIFYIIPSLAVLAGLAGLYGLYILYLGFKTPMMETPQDKVVPYLVVSIVVIVGLWFVVGVIVGAIFAVRFGHSGIISRIRAPGRFSRTPRRGRPPA